MTYPESFAVHLQMAQRLIQVGIALSAEHNLEHLLELIVAESRSLTQSEGGSLYIRAGDSLNFVVSQNEVLANATYFKPFTLPLSKASIAGYVVLTGQTLNIADVYKLAIDLPYRFNPEFDQCMGYRTHSMLTVPLRDGQGTVIGALQLINCCSLPGQPFPPVAVSLAEALASQAAVAYLNARLTQELKAANYDTIFRLSVAAEYRDRDTSFHLKRMSHYSKIIAKHMGFSEADQEIILYASPMHDVGKIGIPDAILLKPGKLTAEERAIMEQHPVIGAKILGGSDSVILQKSAVIALSHHEKFDGSGYPHGLQGQAIPLEGRIVALADVFDALTSRRVYKEAWTLDDVFELVAKSRGQHFDPDVIDAFYAGHDEVMAIYERYQEPASAPEAQQEDHPDATKGNVMTPAR